MRLFSIGFLGFLAASLMGCTPAESEPGLALADAFENAGPVALREVAAVGDGSGFIIGDPAGVAVDRQGRVYVADYDRALVWVLTPEGDSLGTIGRKGRGPGEFMRPSSVAVGPNDSLFVFDDGGPDRVSVFGPAPERAFAYSFRLIRSRNRLPSEVYPTASGPLLARYTRPKNPNLGPAGHWLMQVNRQGEIVEDDLLHLPLMELHIEEPTPESVWSVERPFGRKPVFAADGRGRVCYGWTDSLRVRCSAPDGSATIAFRVDHTALPVTRADLAHQREIWDAETLALIEAAGWHDTYPAYEALAIGTDGRFWVQGAARIRSPDDVSPWHVIDVEAGTFRSTTLPAGQTIQAATETHVYTTLRPIRPEVWVYRIEEGP